MATSLGSVYSPVTQPNLSRSILDVFYSTQGGLFRDNFDEVFSGLEELVDNDVILPKLYQDSLLLPFLDFLRTMGKEHFDKVMKEDEDKLSSEMRSQKQLIPFIAEALLQRNYHGKYYESAFRDLRSFQAIVETIFNTVQANELSLPLPPLVAWTSRVQGPRTFPADKIKKIISERIDIGIVVLPPEHRKGGLLAWASMGHEVGGHLFLHSKPGLVEELQNRVRTALDSEVEKKDQFMVQYLSERVEELASDVLGVLNMGPVVTVSFVGHLQGVKGRLRSESYFPAQRKQAHRTLHLKGNSTDIWIDKFNNKIELPHTTGDFGIDKQSGDKIVYTQYHLKHDPHPVDFLRPYGMIEVVTSLTGVDKNVREGWRIFLEKILTDLKPPNQIVIKDADFAPNPPKPINKEISLESAVKLTQIAAKTIAQTRLSSLDDRSLIDVINWTDQDELYVDELRQASFKTQDFNLASITPQVNTIARHVVSAAILESLEEKMDIEQIFLRMKHYLLQIHESIQPKIEKIESTQLDKS